MPRGGIRVIASSGEREREEKKKTSVTPERVSTTQWMSRRPDGSSEKVLDLSQRNTRSVAHSPPASETANDLISMHIV